MAKPRRNDFLVPTLGVLLDAIAIEAAFLASYVIRFDTTLLTFLPLNEDVPPLGAYLLSSLVVIPIWLFLFNARNMYSARRNVALSDDFFNVTKLVTLGMLIVMSTAFFYRAFSYSRAVFILLWIASVLFLFLGRWLLHTIEKSLYRSGKELRNAVIVGNNDTANRIYDMLNNHPTLGYRIRGYFAQEPAPKESSLAHTNYLGTLDDFPSKVTSEEIELALIAIEFEDYGDLLQLVRQSAGMYLEFMIVPDMIEIMTNHMRLKEIEGIPFITLKGIPMTTWGRITKRAFDIVVSFSLLLIGFPFFLLIAIAIRLNSKGPIFYRQDRVGIDGSHFYIYKFRSMKADAEANTGPVWAKENDPRTTSVGKFLRRTSLDEFPQLMNVLNGEMSLVGPRPERQFFIDQFKDFVPKYLDRHRVKAGMTGWAQVNGLRGPHGTLQERIKYDLHYIENWSLWFDIKILLKTIRTLFR